MVIYKVFDVMLHLEAEWRSKQNILIADPILANQVLGQVLSKYIFMGERFCFYHMFKTFF